VAGGSIKEEEETGIFKVFLASRKFFLLEY
jgi:hypothetical protein